MAGPGCPTQPGTSTAFARTGPWPVVTHQDLGSEGCLGRSFQRSPPRPSEVGVQRLLQNKDTGWDVRLHHQSEELAREKQRKLTSISQSVLGQVALRHSGVATRDRSKLHTQEFPSLHPAPPAPPPASSLRPLFRSIGSPHLEPGPEMVGWVVGGAGTVRRQ